MSVNRHQPFSVSFFTALPFLIGSALCHSLAAQENPQVKQLVSTFTHLAPSGQTSRPLRLVDRFTSFDPLFADPEAYKSSRTFTGEKNEECPPDNTLQLNVYNEIRLLDAINLALCNNPQLRSDWAAIKIQTAAVGEARAAYLPTLSGGVSYLKDNTSYPQSTFNASHLNSNSLYANFAWRLFDFGGRDANRRSANALLAAALANQDAGLQKTLVNVINAYFEAQTAQALLQAKTSTEANAEQLLEVAKRREARGVGDLSDTLQATTALAKAQLEKSRSSGVYDKSRATLIYYLGIPMQSRIQLMPDIIDASPALQKELNEWLEQAQTKHPSLLAARAQLESAKERVNVVRSEGLPTIDFSASYYQNGRPNQGLTPTKTQETVAGVTLTVPLFEGFSRTYKISGAQAQVEQKEADLKDLEHQILLNVLKAHTDTQSALNNLSASAVLLRAAEQALASVQRKFEKGAADILEILNAQNMLADARQERIRSLAEWRSARLRLLASAGLMVRGDI